MAWRTVLWSVLDHLSLPFKFLLNISLTVLAPIGHLGNASISFLLWPLRVLAKFETLYIYMGVAALVGLIAGCFLHLISKFLRSFLNMTSTPKDRGRTAASVRVAKQQHKLDDAWERSYTRKQIGQKLDPVEEKKYAEWLEKDSISRRGDHGLLSQTILEEDSDSF